MSDGENGNSENGNGEDANGSGGEGSQIAAKPEYVDERFYNAETGEVNHEDIHKSWKHASDKLAGKKQAPEAYEMGFSEDLAEEYREDFGADNPLIAKVMEVAKESDMSQEAFNTLLNTIAGNEIEIAKAMEATQQAEFTALGEHGAKRVKELNLWIDATLDKELADGLKGSLTTAKSVEAIEKLKESLKTPSLKTGLDDVDHNTHEELRARQFAKDDNGNRMMQQPGYAAKWRADAAAANFRAT